MKVADNDELIRVQDMCRSFRPRGHEVRPAVRGVNLSVGRGQIVALLGPNGAGKTTTVRVCATLLTPTSGSVRIAGSDVVRQTRQARRNLGLVLGGERGFYARASALENLAYFADLAMVPRRNRDERINALLERVELTERATDRVETYSRGMRQRLHIARALLADPAVILMDEPTIGLDPEAAVNIRRLIRELSQAGKAILLTTHYLYEAQELADEINVIAEGRLLVTGKVDDVAQAAGAGSVTALVVDAVPAHVVAALRDIDGVAGVEVEGSERVNVTVLWRTENADEQAVRLCLGDWRPRAVITRPATLEEAYLALLARERANVNGRANVR